MDIFTIFMTESSNLTYFNKMSIRIWLKFISGVFSETTKHSKEREAIVIDYLIFLRGSSRLRGEHISKKKMNLF